MQFTFDKKASEAILEIDGDNYKYLIKARDKRLGILSLLRNLEDENLYFYKLY